MCMDVNITGSTTLLLLLLERYKTLYKLNRKMHLVVNVKVYGVHTFESS